MYKGTTAEAGTCSKEIPARRPRGRQKTAHADHETTEQKTHVFVTDRAVVVATPDYTRIERPPHGTDYGEPLPRETRAALAEVARHV